MGISDYEYAKKTDAVIKDLTAANANADMIQRASGDMPLSSLSTAGLLVPEQADRFIRTLIEQATILKECRVIPMANPVMQVNKIQFGSRILQAANTSVAGMDDYPPSRWLTASERAQPDLAQVVLNAHEVMAEVNIPYEVIEDNIERENFTDTILSTMAEAVSRDLEDLVINANTGSGTPYYALTNGVIALATSNVVDAGGDSIDMNVIANAVKAMPKQFRVMPNLKFYFTSNADVDIRTTIASRNTGLGDSIFSGKVPVYMQGYEISKSMLMPQGYGFFTDPRNIIVGFHRQVRIEMDRDIRGRTLIFVLSARVDVQLEEPNAIVLIQNASS